MRCFRPVRDSGGGEPPTTECIDLGVTAFCGYTSGLYRTIRADVILTSISRQSDSMTAPQPSGTCQPHDHQQSRRAFFGQALAGAGLGLLSNAAVGRELKRQQKRVLMIFLNGGASQFETWDPKTGRPTGGPFISIPSSVPGYHLCELMPRMATRIHRHTAVIRSLETKNVETSDTASDGSSACDGSLRHARFEGKRLHHTSPY